MTNGRERTRQLHPGFENTRHLIRGHMMWYDILLLLCTVSPGIGVTTTEVENRTRPA